ncbi:MAG: OmpA family protein [Myxococcales bacterium]|nr:OmpA family protein [Myxococcales bacterium]MCB9735107.1 OmpA family protein [Deltaproteobacteria bacterium]
MNTPTPARAARRLVLAAAICLTPALGAAGCATAPPAELQQARTAYHQVANGQARDLAPVELAEARSALVAAEQAFDAEGASPDAVEKANVAYRESQEVSEVAAERQAERVALIADLRAENRRDVALAEVRDDAPRPAGAPVVRLEQSGALAWALRRLVPLAGVEETEDSVMITLADDIFDPGRATLGLRAESRLELVLGVLAAAPGRAVRVEGYADDVGPEGRNVALSQRRADTVERWLVDHGVAPGRVEAVGRGTLDPIASNATPEGRARNRRVQIILGPPTSALTPDDGSAQR